IASALDTPDGAPVDAASVAAALEKMFANRAEREFNPADYQRRLDELARQANLAVDRSSGRADVLEDENLLTAQVGGIAALALEEAAPEEERPLVDRVVRALPELLERGHASALAAAVRGLRARGTETTDTGKMFATHLTKELPRLVAIGVGRAGARDDVRAAL